MDHGLTIGGNPPFLSTCSSRKTGTGADWSKTWPTVQVGTKIDVRPPLPLRKWRKCVAPVAFFNWSRTGATGAAKGLCSSRRGDPKGSLPSDKWSTPLAPKLTGATAFGQAPAAPGAAR